MRKLHALIVVGLILGSFSLVTPTKAAAATLFYAPASVKVNVGQTTTISLYVNASDGAINSAGGTIVLPDSYVSAVSVSKAGSIFTTWPQEPTINGATIVFSGGLPTPGYSGSGGKILSFSIRGTADGTGLISLNSGQVLANDGHGTNILAGSPTATVTVSHNVVGAAISSSSHPDQSKWYSIKDLSLDWTKPTGAISYDYSLDKVNGANGGSGSLTTNAKTFANLSDGVWVFSLTTKFSDGKTAATSFTAHIDTTAPNPFNVAVTKPNGETDPFPVFTMDATDATSGIDHYEVSIDGAAAVSTTDNPYKLPQQVPGTHFFSVFAVDKAGNKTESKGQFHIQGFPGPVITSYPKFVSVLQPITFSGRALYGATVKLFVDSKYTVSFTVKDNLTDNQRAIISNTDLKPDQEVEWSYTYRGALLPGDHTFFATQVKADNSESDRSNEVTIKTLASSLSLGGVIVPMFLVSVILLALIILIILLLIFVWRRSKKRMKSLLVRLKLARDEVDREIDRLEKDINRDIDRVEPPRTVLNRIEDDVASSKGHIDETLDTVPDKDKK